MGPFNVLVDNSEVNSKGNILSSQSPISVHRQYIVIDVGLVLDYIDVDIRQVTTHSLDK